MACDRCGGDPEIATGREAIGTPGCICGAGIRVIAADPIGALEHAMATDRREWVSPVDLPRFATAGSLTPDQYGRYLRAHRAAPGEG